MFCVVANRFELLSFQTLGLSNTYFLRTQHVTHTVCVLSFRWCISGYQCKRREAQTLVWLPQKQGQKNWALAHADQWVTWLIKWLKTHILLAPHPTCLTAPDRTPAFSFWTPFPSFFFSGSSCWPQQRLTPLPGNMCPVNRAQLKIFKSYVSHLPHI